MMLTVLVFFSQLYIKLYTIKTGDKLGFQPSKQGTQKLPASGLILQSMFVKSYY